MDVGMDRLIAIICKILTLLMYFALRSTKRNLRCVKRYIAHVTHVTGQRSLCCTVYKRTIGFTLHRCKTTVLTLHSL